MSVDKRSVRKAGIAVITILVIVAVNILILYKCGVFELYDLKKTYNEALNEGSTIRIYKSGDIITAVLDENNETAEEVDISNQELDGYIESIKDDERRDLMKDYFFSSIGAEVQNTGNIGSYFNGTCKISGRDANRGSQRRC